MNVLKRTLSFVIAIVTLNTAMPQDSHAMIISRGLSHGDTGIDFAITDSAFVNLFMCAVLFPVCALDGKTPIHNSDQLASDLKNNGYTDSEINVIVSDHQMVSAKLNERGQVLIVGKLDTIESIRAEIHSLAPEASDAYAQYLLDSSKVE